MDKVGEKSLEIMKTAHWYNQWLFSFVKPHLKGDILEVGAGIGNFTRLLSRDGPIIATDIDKSYINKLKKNFGKRVAAGYGDIEKDKYFFGNKKFDTIVCLNVLEHLKDDAKSVFNMYNLLKRGGKLILLVPSCQWAYGYLDEDLGHFRRYSKRELVDIVDKLKFKIITARHLNVPGLLGWLINGRILKRRVLPQTQLKIFDKISAPFLSLEKLIEPPIGLSVFMVSKKV